MKSTIVQRPDYILASTIGVLLLFGIVILASVSTAISQQKFGSPSFYLFRYFLFGLLPGLIAGFIAFKMPLHFFKKRAPLFLAVSILLMILVFFPRIGIQAGGANRWLNIGFTSFQPSEFLKLSFILYLAAWLPNLTDKIRKRSKTFIAFLSLIGTIGLLLILQPDISTLGMIIASGILIYFLSGVPLKYIFSVIIGGLAALAVLVKIEPYRFSRISVFLKPGIDPMGLSYQIKQALITIGSGGIWGRGLGLSMQKFGFLPEPIGDSVFAIFSEETGFIGALILISLFLIFIWRGFKIVRKTEDRFCRLAAAGIVFWIAMQAFVNMGSMLAILPLSGIPLPFVSYGGSAMIAELIGVGILLNISKHHA